VKVDLYQADQGASRLYRLAEPARVANNAGIHAQVLAEFPILPGPLQVGRHVPAPTDADVVVFQRPAKHKTVEAIVGFQRQGVAVIVDVDDDLSCLHPAHPARDAFNPALNPQQNFQHLRRACALADLVTVTTPALAARYGAHGRVEILPNCVPEALLARPPAGDGRTLGWSGRSAHHPGDLQATCGGVAEALRRTGWRFLIVGPAEDARARLALDEEPAATGGLELADWYAGIGRLDVGIVPLGDTAFNAAKSTLKGLEYAALGIPFVASPSHEYQALARQGVGVLAASRSRNWRSALVALMDDETLRHEAAQRGRTAVHEHHTFEVNAPRWCDAWTDAIANRKGRR
jgi:hypothetical protein